MVSLKQSETARKSLSERRRGPEKPKNPKKLSEPTTSTSELKLSYSQPKSAHQTPKTPDQKSSASQLGPTSQTLKQSQDEGIITLRVQILITAKGEFFCNAITGLVVFNATTDRLNGLNC